MPFHDEEKPKRSSQKPDQTTKTAEPLNRTAIIVALITLFGVIFTAMYQVPSNKPGETQPLLLAIIVAITGNNPIDRIESATDIPTVIVEQPTITLTATNTHTPTATASVTVTNTPIPIEPFCAFLTSSQISSLQQIQDARDAVRQAEIFAGSQNDYVIGETIPENVIIATNIYTTNFDSMGVTAINNINGYGLFLTNRAITASYPGTYWCVKNDLSTTAIPATPTQPTSSTSICRPIDEENNMPSSSEYNLIVEPNQFHIWSSGRITVNYKGQIISSVQDEGYKGFISVFLPVDNKQTIYNIMNVNPTYNYHAIYENCSPQQRINETERHARNLTSPGDCGNGCDEVYIHIFIGSSLEEELFSP